jgi:ribosomal protein S18 acetylase RimI-like enzyme
VSRAPSVRLATSDDARQIAELHAQLISEGFLAVLGPAFLERLYRRIARGATSFAFVGVDQDGTIVGFVAVAERTSTLYRQFLVRDGIQAACRAIPTVLRHLRSVIETLRHGVGSHEDRPGAEILSLAVARQARGHGVGTALVMAATSELRRRGITDAHVVTASDNAAALRTYLGCGFERRSTIEVHRGVAQELLAWR